MKSISEMAEKYGIRMSECENKCGSVFTTPEWEDWPEELYEEVENEGWNRRNGPDGSYWIADDEVA